MAFVELEAGDAQEAESVPEDTYELEIISFVPTVSKKAKEAGWDIEARGPNMYVADFAVNSEEFPHARTVRSYFSLPMPDDEKKAKDFKTLNLVRLFQAFGINYKLEGGNIGFDDEDPVGSRGTCLLTLGEPNDNGDRYNELVLPRAKEDAADSSTGSAKPRRRRA